MSFVRIKLTSLILVMLLPVLLVLAASVKTSYAAPNVSLLCITKVSSGEQAQISSVSWPVSGKCTTNTTSVKPSSLPSDFKAMCALYDITKNSYAIYNGINSAGKTSCDTYTDDPLKYTLVNLIARSAVKGTDPGTTTTSTPPVKSPTVKNTTGSSSTNGKSSSGTNDAGSCPEGFDAKGPLCVPNNPFDNGDGIAGKGSIGELASTIISILLGISGIVAVIMIIIGGYQVMTARGNETQQTNGRKTLTNALIGLAIIIVSFAVVQAVTNYLTKSQT